MKRSFWNIYQQKQAPPQSFPFPAPPFGCFWEMFPLAVPEMFSSKHVVYKNQGTLCFVPVLHDPCKAAITKSKEINPTLFYFFFHLFSMGTVLYAINW